MDSVWVKTISRDTQMTLVKLNFEFIFHAVWDILSTALFSAVVKQLNYDREG